MERNDIIHARLLHFCHVIHNSANLFTQFPFDFIQENISDHLVSNINLLFWLAQPTRIQGEDETFFSSCHSHPVFLCVMCKLVAPIHALVRVWCALRIITRSKSHPMPDSFGLTGYTHAHNHRHQNVSHMYTYGTRITH